MKIYDDKGEEVLALTPKAEESQLKTHLNYAEGAAQLDLPAADVSFENTKQGLLVHAGIAGTDKKVDVLVEYDDVKALKQIPGKGLVSFALKAFR